ALAWLVPAGRAATRELELALARFALAAVRRGVVAWLAGPAAPAPCAFRRPEAFASLFAGPRAPRTRAPACGACVVSDVCAGPVEGATAAGFEDGGRGAVAFEAATATVRHAAEVQAWVESGEGQRWGRANFVSVGSEPDLRGGVALSALLRGLYHCNQRCTFCWVDLEQPRVPTAAVEQALAMTALEGMQVLSITGGEPTLDRRLPAQVRLARALGALEVTLQTNAVRLDEPERAQALAQAGLTRAFVSLHGATAEVSDAITRAPGTFARTLGGIRNLLAAGISVGVGVVFTTENRSQARALVTLVATELRGVDLTLSVASPVNERVDVRAVTPRYSELAPTLREAVATARALGVPFAGLFGQCGLPPCILDGDPACFPELEREHPVWSSAEDFVHAPVCEGCRLRPKCPGIRRAYAEVHGLDELHAL
ncbi:MAG: radical SAM protein, partial [Myxococcales bacterium]|nr:radical SAM protein [Myxococcales bacterium]